MFNLAQRQLRISLWGTEPVSRSTAKNPSEKRKLTLVKQLEDSDSNFPELLPVTLFLLGGPKNSLPLLCLQFALLQHCCETTKWDNATSMHSLLSKITWYSVAIKCANFG